MFFDIARPHEVGICPFISAVAAPDLLHDGGAQLTACHAAQPAVGQHVEDGVPRVLLGVNGVPNTEVFSET